jgi:hypothetical protein
MSAVSSLAGLPRVHYSTLMFLGAASIGSGRWRRQAECSSLTDEQPGRPCWGGGLRSGDRPARNRH